MTLTWTPRYSMNGYYTALTLAQNVTLRINLIQKHPTREPSTFLMEYNIRLEDEMHVATKGSLQITADKTEANPIQWVQTNALSLLVKHAAIDTDLAAWSDDLRKLNDNLIITTTYPANATTDKTPDFHIGDVVYMHDCIEADENKGALFVVRSEPWKVSDTHVVLLYGRAGGFDCDCLAKYPENENNVLSVKGGRRSLYCRRCHTFVCNTANYEMRREGAIAYSHTCGRPDPTERKLEDHD